MSHVEMVTKDPALRILPGCSLGVGCLDGEETTSRLTQVVGRVQLRA